MKIFINSIFLFILIIGNNAYPKKNSNFINKFIRCQLGDNQNSFLIYKRDNGSFGYKKGNKVATDESGDVVIDPKNMELTFVNKLSQKDSTYILKYKETDKDLMYNEYIGDYPIISSRIKNGSIRYFDNIKVITMDDKFIKSNYKIYIREYPSISSDYYILYFYNENEKIIFLNKNALNSGMIIIIGRTEIKFKIDDKENYWYLIKFNPYLYPLAEVRLNDKNKKIEKYPIYAWIYGGYIELVDLP